MIKKVKIKVPDGFEIDQEKSTFEEIVFKKTAKQEDGLMEFEHHTAYFTNGEFATEMGIGPNVVGRPKKGKYIWLNNNYKWEIRQDNIGDTYLVALKK